MNIPTNQHAPLSSPYGVLCLDRQNAVQHAFPGVRGAHPSTNSSLGSATAHGHPELLRSTFRVVGKATRTSQKKMLRACLHSAKVKVAAMTVLPPCCDLTVAMA